MAKQSVQSAEELAHIVATRFAQRLVMAGAEFGWLVGRVLDNELQQKCDELFGDGGLCDGIWQELPADKLHELALALASKLELALLKRHGEGMLLLGDLEAASVMHWLDGLMHAHRMANKREAAKFGDVATTHKGGEHGGRQ